MRALSLNFILLFVTALLLSCGASKDSRDTGLVPTIYYKPTIQLDISKCEASEKKDLLSSKDDKVLTTLCEKDYDLCLMQGSCVVDDGRKSVSYNFHSMRNGTARFIVVDTVTCPFGYGVRSVCLDPYFSVAADLSIYELGEVFYISKLQGVILPNGEVHTGFVIVRDAGGGVTGEGRFDFFTGFLSHRESANPLAQLGFGDPKKRFSYRRATEQEKQVALAARNYPSLRDAVLREGRQKFP